MSSDSPNIFPALRYRDARAAIDFLVAAFGFEATEVFEDDDGRVVHAELHLGPGAIMLGSTGGGDERFDRAAGAGSVYVALDDVDAHFQRARAGGAEVVRELEDTDYGSREYTACDPEGNLWSFGTYRPQRPG